MGQGFSQEFKLIVFYKETVDVYGLKKYDSIWYIIKIDTCSLFIIDQVPVTGKRNQKLQITNGYCVRFGMKRLN